MTPINLEKRTESNPFMHSDASSAQQPDDRELFIRHAFDENPRIGYELLFRRYYQPLRSHATRLVYSHDAAEDIVSEVFLDFWQKQAFKKITTSYKLYLLMAVRYGSFAHLRREFKHASLDSSDALMNSQQTYPADKIMLFDELSFFIDQGVKSLPPQNQKVFMLSRFEGKTHAEIANQLAISTKTVEVHIHRALRILRSIIANY